jgi:hypothetical protein
LSLGEWYRKEAMGRRLALLKRDSVVQGREEKGGEGGHVRVEVGEGGEGGLAWWSAVRGDWQRPLTVGRE